MSEKTKMRLKFIISGVAWIAAGVLIGNKIEATYWDYIIPLVGFACTLFGLKFVAPDKPEVP